MNIKKIKLYNKDIKIPNAKNIDKNGNTPFYGISIYFNSGLDQPYVFEIMNCQAQPLQGVKLGADMKKVVNYKKYEVSAAEEEFSKFIDKINARLNDFETLNSKNSFNLLATVLKPQFEARHNNPQ